jgi:hypothetical protein
MPASPNVPTTGFTIIETERVRYEAGEITHRVTLGELFELALAALERERQLGQGGSAP